MSFYRNFKYFHKSKRPCHYQGYARSDLALLKNIYFKNAGCRCHPMLCIPIPQLLRPPVPFPPAADEKRPLAGGGVLSIIDNTLPPAPAAVMVRRMNDDIRDLSR